MADHPKRCRGGCDLTVFDGSPLLRDLVSRLELFCKLFETRGISMSCLLHPVLMA